MYDKNYFCRNCLQIKQDNENGDCNLRGINLKKQIKNIIVKIVLSWLFCNESTNTRNQFI